jgi:chromosome partitioning protein
MAHILAIANRKGGSAKTITTLNLAGALAQAGYATLVIDLDPQASLTRGLNIPEGEVRLSDVLVRGGEGFDDLIQPTCFDNLFAIPADSDLNGIESGLREVAGRELRLRRCLGKYLTRQL